MYDSIDTTYTSIMFTSMFALFTNVYTILTVPIDVVAVVEINSQFNSIVLSAYELEFTTPEMQS